MKTQLAAYSLRAVRRLERIKIPSITRGAAYSVVVLFTLDFVLAGACLLFTTFWVHHVQATQQRQGQVVEAKLCTTLGQLAALGPPAGDPASNPSRGFDQRLHATLAQLGPDLGCR